jgi:uncharacterized protein YggE
MRTTALIGVFAFAIAANAQVTTTLARRTISTTGTATVPATPDKANVELGVTTQATTAQDASGQNATQVSSVLNALRGVLGPTATITTVSYTLSPLYNNPGPGQPQTIIGYQASNIVDATITDLTLIGKVIDAGIGGGANRVQSITFGLQNPDPVQTQALKSAAASALAQAKTIASGLGVNVGNVLQASQGGSVSPPIAFGAAGGASATTPIEPGAIQVSATVSIVAEII